jgi:hypothetical protein
MQHRGLPKVDWQFTLAMAAHGLIPLATCSLSACRNPCRTAIPPHCRSSHDPLTAATDQLGSHREAPDSNVRGNVTGTEGAVSGELVSGT